MPKPFGPVAILIVALAIPAVLRAGANTWTGGRPADTNAGGRSLVASHPDNPDVVYAAFAVDTDRSGLYRSADGGRSWIRLRSFEEITALLVHPASASTIYVAVGELSGPQYHNRIYKSTDDGATWSSVLDTDRVTALAGSPIDASVVLAGGWAHGIHKTDDGGATWSVVGVEALSQSLASLVFDPREPTTAYAGIEGYEYWGVYPGGLFKTTDGGNSWQKTGPEALGFSVVAIDPTANGALYVATGYPWWGDQWEQPSNLLRSDDGETWAMSGEGLSGLAIRSLTVDPHVSGTLYAGTSAGVFRTRDGGHSWTPFGQRIAGVPIRSLAIDGEGRRLLAGTSNAVYELELARGPIDVAGGPGAESRVLVWDADRLSIGKVDASGTWTGGAAGATSSTWTAVALAEDGGRSRVLWQCGDGRSALEIVGPSGRESVSVFPSVADWVPSDVSAGADASTHLLWTGTDGRMFIAEVSATGAVNEGPVYGPAAGWSAVAIADGSGDTWVLWRSADGRFAISAHRDGAMVDAHKYAADADGWAQDLAVGADGHPRILRTNPEGLASVATIDADGQLAAGHRYERPGLRARRIATGTDGLTRVLFSGADGNGELLLLDGANMLKEVDALSARTQP